MDDLGDWKAAALARRLSASSPNATVTGRPSNAEQTLDSAYLGTFDMVIETTGDRRLLELLQTVAAARAVTYVSLSISTHGRRLFAYMARATTFPLAEFDNAYQPFGLAAIESGEELPMEGIGCWHPVFPARADEVWIMASAAVGLLNDAGLFGDLPAAMHVIERTVDAEGRFSGLASLAS
jgi:hypothetical protein